MGKILSPTFALFKKISTDFPIPLMLYSFSIGFILSKFGMIRLLNSIKSPFLRRFSIVFLCSRITSYNVCYTKLLRVIKGYSALIDHKQLGLDMTAILEVKTTKGHSPIRDQIKKLDNVYGIWGVTGQNDLMILAKFSDRNNFV